MTHKKKESENDPYS